MLSYLIRDVPGVLTMREFGKDRRPGVPKNKQTTMEMALLGIEAVRSRRFHYSAQMQAGPSTEVIAMKRKLHDQMRDYQLEIRHDPENPFVEPKYTWRGLNNDDLLVSVLMHMYWDEFFWEASGRPDYDNFKRGIEERAGL